MTDKCVNTGNWFNQCENIKIVTDSGIGDIHLQVLSSMSSNESRLALVAGRFKKNKLELAFCPACGVNIETEIKKSA